MEHDEFVRKYRENAIRVHIDESKSGCFYNKRGLIPRHLKKKPLMIRGIAFGGLFAGGGLFFVAPWWLALVVLFAGLSQFPRAHKAAADGLREAALADPGVYALAFSQRILIVTESRKT